MRTEIKCKKLRAVQIFPKEFTVMKKAVSIGILLGFIYGSTITIVVYFIKHEFTGDEIWPIFPYVLASLYNPWSLCDPSTPKLLSFCKNPIFALFFNLVWPILILGILGGVLAFAVYPIYVFLGRRLKGKSTPRMV